DALEIEGNREERPATRQVFAQLLTGALRVSPRSRRGAVVAAPGMEARHTPLGRVDPEPIGQLLEARRPGLETPEETRRQRWRSLGLEEFFEHRVDPIHVAMPPAPVSRSPCRAPADS